MQVCTLLQTDNHASTPPLSFFTGRMPFLPPNQQRQSTEGKCVIISSPFTAVLANYRNHYYYQGCGTTQTSPWFRFRLRVFYWFRFRPCAAGENKYNSPTIVDYRCFPGGRTLCTNWLHTGADLIQGIVSYARIKTRTLKKFFRTTLTRISCTLKTHTYVNIEKFLHLMEISNNIG